MAHEETDKKYFNEIGDINAGSLSSHIKKYYVFEKNNVNFKRSRK